MISNVPYIKGEDVVGVVLAGGEGRRFRPYTDIIPKPMLPVGPEEKPLLEYIIRWFSKHGIAKITLLVATGGVK
jgi:mannose-1-phosphate guanylyltransferase